MSKVLFVLGTRPEAIKLAPLIIEFQQNPNIEVKVCSTGQHREMLDQVLNFFEIQPDYDLNIMKKQQSLGSITCSILTHLNKILESFKPDYVFVHGDTTTTFATSLTAFYKNILIWHIEAGLRTWNIESPFPEEANRQLTGKLAFFHAAPTLKAKDNLIRDNVNEKNIIVTGNTVIDALLIGIQKITASTNATPEIANIKKQVNTEKQIILVTLHRRENQGELLAVICDDIKHLALEHNNIEIVFPVHMNPFIRNVVNKKLSGVANIKIIEPLAYPSFIWLMNNAYFILSDSGGIQEEAPSLNKPVLVVRDTTERPEVIENGAAMLVDPRIPNNVYLNCKKLLSDEDLYKKMSQAGNPFGNGTASKKILNYFLSQL
ncbi:UDP-N-acetylglucosamine 2-epimerase (non-hydrolyzing) [Salmonella enterica]|nr:UDP-N-acetylglucosamine 2-epimerase (non-hydrolyzing) [Salmonella enterica]EKS3671437.1 UDP-N-acetylglucosamine 2-epimerase (non-hydrolyzing) [Salmonella enterica]ELW6562500.1 UDP-N-acetylglucosamine 2-epimerase (non-hydrolyzing) [Salmonella enterica]ELZ1403404.1 UDP-N-acetylglucosamine 2-epimerase (non-hydrolyzing) [Salmonella enterica]